MNNQPNAEINWDERTGYISLNGCWTVKQLGNIAERIKDITDMPLNQVKIDGSNVQALDSAGALVLHDLFHGLSEQGSRYEIHGFNDAQQKLLDFVNTEAATLDRPFPALQKPNFLYRLGGVSAEHFTSSCNFLAFIGETFVEFIAGLFRPATWQWRNLAGEVETAGVNGLLIIAFMSILIGVVVAYQLSAQLVRYGANIFIVDFTGIAILREFAPLITSVIVAARTSTAYAAFIGTMKINEELDVLRIMGIPPIERLVIPRILALIVVVPLLTVWSDIWGVFGGMVMAKNILGVNFTLFLDRFQEKIAIHHYVFGLIKTPVFAMIIASAGCYQGFRTAHNAESLGSHTTKGVVQAIFLIICADAGFSVIFNELGL